MTEPVPSTTTTPPSTPERQEAKIDQLTTIGTRWSERIEKHPIRVALQLFITGIVIGFSAGAWVGRVTAPTSAEGAVAASLPCKIESFEIPAKTWNTGAGIEHSCGGTTFTLVGRRELKADGTVMRRLVRIRAQSESGPTMECTVGCDDGQGRRKIMSTCPLLPTGLSMDCGEPDTTTIVWLPSPI